MTFMLISVTLVPSCQAVSDCLIVKSVTILPTTLLLRVSRLFEDSVGGVHHFNTACFGLQTPPDPSSLFQQEAGTWSQRAQRSG